MSQSLPEAVVRDTRGRPLLGRQPEQRLRRTKRQSAVALAGVPLFAGFSKRELERLAADADELSFNAGDTLVREGLLGDTMFVVLSGQGKVMKGSRRINSVRPGDFFGELSAIDGQPRSASVIAETPMVVLRVFRRTLLAMIDAEPQLAMKLLGGIVKRLRHISNSLES